MTVKKNENQLRINRVTAVSLVSPFFWSTAYNDSNSELGILAAAAQTSAQLLHGCTAADVSK